MPFCGAPSLRVVGNKPIFICLAAGNPRLNRLTYGTIKPGFVNWGLNMGDVAHDQLVLIRIEGMHCHKCERAIQNTLTAQEGVHEVEVDFATGQASVLFDRDQMNVKQLMDAVEAVGYRATGFTQNKADTAAH